MKMGRAASTISAMVAIAGGKTEVVVDGVEEEPDVTENHSPVFQIHPGSLHNGRQAFGCSPQPIRLSLVDICIHAIICTSAYPHPRSNRDNPSTTKYIVRSPYVTQHEAIAASRSQIQPSTYHTKRSGMAHLTWPTGSLPLLMQTHAQAQLKHPQTCFSQRPASCPGSQPRRDPAPSTPSSPP